MLKMLIHFGYNCVKLCFSVVLLSKVIWSVVNAGPGLNAKSWPSMKNYDIWEVNSIKVDSDIQVKSEKSVSLRNGNNTFDTTEKALEADYRRSKVLNFFTAPVDEECLSDDGRRSGVCLNVYECRLKGGLARGECALGFGVCCVFTLTCDQEVSSNISYIISPNFPALMPTNMTSCKIKVKMISKDISQLRIDFNHFSLGQPNRTTGICDGDVFSVSGGLGGAFTLCGQNSGQHVYYDVGVETKKSRQTVGAGVGTGASTANATMSFNATIAPESLNDIEILMNFSSRLYTNRLWEIRITQIPFSQRAPAGCLQYFTGVQGIIQTFNFAENGRHLANQNYRACVRQESKMCSIAYEPCNDQAFRVGPSVLSDAPVGTTPAMNVTEMPLMDSFNASDPTTSQATETSTASMSPPANVTEAANATQADDPDEVEGSGGGDVSSNSASTVSTQATPTRGGFDVIGFFRNMLGYRRSGRQFTSRCTDRITLPCIVEDFIGEGASSIPDCEPVHCGSSFCSSGRTPCRMESTVTPFGLRILFGNGLGKGSPEDNIGACLKYVQMPCL